MAVTIGSNVASLAAQRGLSESTGKLSATYERLSSGLRINRAADDPAGLAVVSQLNVTSKIYGQAVRNINDGISYLSVADSALGALSDITVRQQELATQAANGTYNHAQRHAMTTEANALVDEFNRIVAQTQFNGLSVFAPNSGGTVSIQLGTGSGGVIGASTNDQLGRTVGAGTFGSDTSFAAATNSGIALVDLNGDGALDLAATGTTGGAGKTTIYFNDSQGNFTAAASYNAETTSSSDVLLVDINGDGAADLVTAGLSGASNQVTVRLNDGSGNFGAATSYAAPGVTIALQDLNGDGAADLITGGSAVTVRLNNGSGSFGSAVTLYNSSNFESLAVADFDGDGHQDIAVLTSQDGVEADVTLSFNSGNGTFGRTAVYDAGDIASRTLSVADVNGDFAPDILVSGLELGGTIVRLNQGDGTFSTSTSAAASNGVFPQDQVSADLNGDGYVDLIHGGWNNGDAGISFNLNNGHGGFGPSVNYFTAGGSPSKTALGDINRDGVLDAVYTTGGLIASRLQNTTKTSSITHLDLTVQSAARATLPVLQQQLQRIELQRGVIGSFQSRLGTALNTVSATRENVIAAASRIEDADVAGDAAELTRLQILQQSSAAVLAQAKQAPAIALSLLSS